MSENFFDKYQEFVVAPPDEKADRTEPFNPQGYTKHYILTFSLFDSLISCWREAKKYHIDVRKSLEKAVGHFNKKNGSVHLQILELEEEKAYFVLALSCATTEENEEEVPPAITSLLEKDFANDLLIGETWYQLIGFKGKFERRLFSYTSKAYTI